jgi:hypothetical protein
VLDFYPKLDFNRAEEYQYLKQLDLTGIQANLKNDL